MNNLARENGHENHGDHILYNQSIIIKLQTPTKQSQYKNSTVPIKVYSRRSVESSHFCEGHRFLSVYFLPHANIAAVVCCRSKVIVLGILCIFKILNEVEYLPRKYFEICTRFIEFSFFRKKMEKKEKHHRGSLQNMITSSLR